MRSDDGIAAGVAQVHPHEPARGAARELGVHEDLERVCSPGRQLQRLPGTGHGEQLPVTASHRERIERGERLRHAEVRDLEDVRACGNGNLVLIVGRARGRRRLHREDLDRIEQHGAAHGIVDAHTGSADDRRRRRLADQHEPLRTRSSRKALGRGAGGVRARNVQGCHK